MGVDINYCRSAYPVNPNIERGLAIDIGANIGGFSSAYNDRFDEIIYFEANPETFKITQENLKSYSNIRGFNLGVSDISGKKIKLMEHFSKDIGSVTCSPTITETGMPDWIGVIGEVETISLEGIYEMIGDRRINYLKLDCECSEYEILLNKDLSRIDYIAMELHAQMGIEKYNELINYLGTSFTIKGDRSYNKNRNTLLYLDKK